MHPHADWLHTSAVCLLHRATQGFDVDGLLHYIGDPAFDRNSVFSVPHFQKCTYSFLVRQVAPFSLFEALCSRFRRREWFDPSDIRLSAERADD